MIEATQIIRNLWNGEGKNKKNYDANNDGNINDEEQVKEHFIDFNGEYFLIRHAKLYTLPKKHIPIYLAATGSQSAKAAAKYSDGLITFLKPNESKEILEIFDKTAKKEGRRQDPSYLEKIAEYKVSFSKDYDKAFESTKFWRATLIKNVFNLEIGDPRKLEQKAKRQVPDERLKESMQIITSIEDCIKPIEEYFKAGFTRVYIHSTSPDEIEFVQSFSKKVLPYFTGGKDI